MALVPIIYAGIEIGLSAADAYSTGTTLLDPCASGGEKALSTSLFLVGALAPGGGYSTGAKITKKIKPGANEKIIKAATKSKKKENSLLKKVDTLEEIDIKPGKEPFWSKLLRIIKNEELPKTKIKVPGKK